jgi:hypothetical protein
MTIVPISLGTRSNPGRHLADGSARLINCYAEDAGGEGKTPWPIYAASGLSALVTLTGGGGVRAMETIDTNLYVLAGRSLFKVDENFNAVQIGGIPTDGPAYMARNMRESYPQIAVVSDGGAWLIENGALTQVTDTDLPPPIAVAQSDGYFAYPTTRSRWFISGLQQGGTIDGLEFASAEASPDEIVGIAELAREFVIFGSKSIEWWQNIGADPFPYARSATASLGCLSGKSVTRIDRTLAWVAHDATVRLMDGYGGRRISTHAVERSITAEPSPSSITSTSWSEGGHVFLSVSGTAWSWVYDLATGYWHERESYGLDRWRISEVIRFAGRNVAGDYATGKLYELGPSHYAEGDDALVMTVQTPAVHAYPHGVKVNRLFVDPIPGVGLNSTAQQDLDPEIMIEWSKDNGATFGNQRTLPIGMQGVRMRRVMTTRLGASGEDGFVFRFSVSAAVVKGLTGAAADIEKLEV